tara:strand:- start:376 stop:2814 length:2439 start_codon:yes stop_codon:yes gene_type:complete
MTSSYQSTAFQSSARPVDTFVRQSTVPLIKDDAFSQLTKALSAVNPLLDMKMQDVIEEDVADFSVELAQKGFKQIVDEHKKKYGDKATRQLIGGSVFTQEVFDKTQAQNVATTLKPELLNLYQNKTYAFTQPDGQEVELPISHFSIDTPQYQEFLQDAANLTTQKTEGLKSKYIARYLFPYQQQVLDKINESHIETHNEYKIERHKEQLGKTLFNSWVDYQDGNQGQALQNFQNYIEDSVSLGLSEAVTTKELLKIAKNQAARVFDIEQQSGRNGYNAALRYLDFVGKLKHGPQQKQKDGTVRQRFLADSFGLDILKFKTQLADSYEKIKKIEIEAVQANKEKNFIKFVKEFGDDNASLADLVRANPEDREFIFDQIEIYSDNRDELFDEFNYKVAIGYYGNDSVQMFTDLAKIKVDIGETYTEEDRKNYSKSYDKAFSRAGSKIRNFDTPTQRLHTDALKLLGNKGDMFQEFQDAKYIPLYLELKERVNRRIIDEVDDSKLNEQQREDKFREITSFYFSNIKAIKTGSYEEVGVFDTAEEKIKRIEDQVRDDAIQKLSEDYGLSMENATQIYDEDQVERFTENTVPQGSLNITPEEGETTQVQTENTTDVTTTEPGLIELLREGIGNLFSMDDNEKEQLTTQLSSIRENLDETSVGVVDTILNALSGPPAMAGEMPSVLDEIDITQPFDFNSLYRLALEVGFPPEDAKTAAAVALAESSGRASIDTVKSGLDPNKENEFSLGLWQIDMQDTPGYMVGEERRPLFGIKSNEELYNPLTNAKAAKILYDKKGGKFTDWATFNDGKYKKFLPKN